MYRKLLAQRNAAQRLGGAKQKALEKKTQGACHLFALSGKCKCGENCKFSHDAAVCEEWKASNPTATLREVLEEEGVVEDMNERVPPELEGLVCEEAPPEEEEEEDAPQM